jgi:hypothetical protein
MSTLGSLIIVAIILIVGSVLWAAFYDQGDDTTDWDLVVVNYAPAEVVAAVAWPQPQTVLHNVPLDTPIPTRAVPCDDRGVPLWYHEMRGTTPYYEFDHGRHDGSQTRVWAGYVPPRLLALTEPTGEWSIVELTGELVGAGAR